MGKRDDFCCLRTDHNVKLNYCASAKDKVDVSMSPKLNTTQEVTLARVKVATRHEQFGFVNQQNNVPVLPRNAEDGIELLKNIFAVAAWTVRDTFRTINEMRFYFISTPRYTSGGVLMVQVKINDREFSSFTDSQRVFARYRRFSCSDSPKYQDQLPFHFFSPLK